METFDKIFVVNARGLFLCTQEATQHVKYSGYRDVLVSTRHDALRRRNEMDRGGGSGGISCQHGVVSRRMGEEGEGRGKEMEEEDCSNLTKKNLSDHHKH